MLVLFYTVGAWCRCWWWLAGLVSRRPAPSRWGGVRPRRRRHRGRRGWIVLFWTVGAVGVGRITPGGRSGSAVRRRSWPSSQQGRGAATRLAAARERQALASELHDTVAHAMTVVCLQAGAQRRSRRGRRRRLRTIATTASGSLAELRDGLDAIESTARPLDRSRLTAVGRRVGVDVGVTAPSRHRRRRPRRWLSGSSGRPSSTSPGTRPAPRRGPGLAAGTGCASRSSTGAAPRPGVTGQRHRPLGSGAGRRVGRRHPRVGAAPRGGFAVVAEIPGGGPR